ncbi:3-dehydroquinate synthase [Oceanibacterium hippocampi]|uniref:3-dehydroquinate synthase n=1 Tax=Oceanibacterium hippocampi TaxID=745714 RepID=A0A1Y5S598_9PROT|nr:3-dehydroquinate synthase [Oceanibacterium hippocampi]
MLDARPAAVPDRSPEATATAIEVGLGARAYRIHIGAGLLARAGGLLAPLLGRPSTVIVTDRNVADAHLDSLRASLAAAGIAAEAIVLEPGEASKSFAGYARLCEDLLDHRLDRHDMIVAFGGGVVGDLAGFAAATLKRGIRFAQIPTTLLAQVDSSVGGKTGINTRHGKNLVGAFHQPDLVIADTAVLATLPRRELLAGYAEVVKYGLLGDAAFFGWLEQQGRDMLDGDQDALARAVARSCEMKAEIVAADERETGRRALLNLGHTFGHALEAELGYDGRLLHGEGVAVGLHLAFALSARLGLAPAADADRIAAHLRAVGLPASPAGLLGPDCDGARLYGHMTQDKKARDGRIGFILANGIGHAFQTDDVAAETVRAFLDDLLDG